MASLTEHKRRILEHLQEINDAIDYGIEQKPITIGFHTSACVVEMLEFLLHTLNQISAGKTIKHNWFSRPKPGQKIEPMIDRKLPVSFPNKDDIYNLIYTIEENRDTLIYGKSTKQQIEQVLTSFAKARKLIEEQLGGENFG